MTTLPRLRIGEVSKATGVAVGALRYYEEMNLLAAERGANGYRYYLPAVVQQVKFIKKAQALGFSLEKIGEVLTVHEHGNVPCELVREILQDKIEQLTLQIQKMTDFRAELEQYRDQWRQTTPPLEPGDICPLIETVALDLVSD